MTRFRPNLTALISLTLVITGVASHSQTAAAGEAEAAKCLERIAAVQRDVLGKYEDGIAELQLQFQKAADLEGALAVRAERKRLQAEHRLTEKQLVNEPRALRTLQQQSIAKIAELTAALVNESVPKLVELKKSLTVGGKLDDAVTVRDLIEKLQNDHLRVERPEAGQFVPAETLLVAYAADRERADKTYKGVRLTSRGVVGAFRPDPADNRNYIVFLTKGPNSGWIACLFNTGNLRFREEKQFNTNFLVIMDRNELVARIQAGQSLDVQGNCDGFEDTVKLSKCEIVR
jgi:tRNA_anti-like